MQPVEIYNIIHEKYEKLIARISYQISGDRAICAFEDNYQDLWMAVYEAVDGFTRQNDYANGPVEDWINTRIFDKYLKTCLWNKKNHKGKNVSQRYKIHRDVVPAHMEEVLNVCAPASSDYPVVLDEVRSSLSEAESKVLSTLLQDPNRYLTAQGKVKIAPLQRKLNWTRKAVEDCYKSIQEKMGEDQNQSI